MKIVKYFFFASLLALGACGDDDNNKDNGTLADVVELKVDLTDIRIAQGDERIVNILSGNGEYVVVSANDKVVTAEVEGNTVKLKALERDNHAQSVVYLTDKYEQRVKIMVTTAATFDLKLSQTLFTLYSQVEGADEAEVRIYTGNGGYTVGFHQEEGENAVPDCIQLYTDALEETEKFRIKGIAQGSAELEVKDRQGKTAYVTVNVIAPKPILTDADEDGVTINGAQGKAKVRIIGGNGEYKILDSGDAKIMRLEIYGNEVTVIGRRVGTTSFTITDAKNQVSKQITVDILPGEPQYMNLGRDYGVWTHFGEMVGEGVAAIKEKTNNFKLTQMTWETVTRIDETNWLQTFMGKEGYFILRGGVWEGNKGRQMELVGTGDKLQLRTGHGAFELGKWMHIALVVDCSKGKDDYNEKYKLYVNGKQVKWDDYHQTDIDYQEIDLCAGNDGGKISIGRASDDRRFLCGALREARIWNVCRTVEQLKANATELQEEHPDGLLARWIFSPGASTTYVEDATNADYDLVMHICKYNSWTETDFPLERFGDANEIVLPFN
ncbi:LamG-like jellyroll fold domain-containing protein [Bacteroides acidifaciens]|uniref:LamG-like jellyroll fold domain-containing protein n=1 Tax=Bacteroides acidifaciens TaxID=85831 RepID=UPI00242E978E|nr:LamG-like jellyroll fold domain-containing protein [Bacteroides acidifaciens]